MKINSFLCVLFAFLAVQFSAFGSGAVPVRQIMSKSPVLAWQYSELIASTVKGLKGMQVNNTGNHVIALAFGAVGSEVQQIIVGPKQDTAFMPVDGGYATRLSAISLDGPEETGELDVNVFYN